MALAPTKVSDPTGSPHFGTPLTQPYLLYAFTSLLWLVFSEWPHLFGLIFSVYLHLYKQFLVLNSLCLKDLE
jgi:hypothetical protein